MKVRCAYSRPDAPDRRAGGHPAGVDHGPTGRASQRAGGAHWASPARIPLQLGELSGGTRSWSLPFCVRTRD